MTFEHWEKAGSFSSGFTNLSATVFFPDCMEKGCVQQKRTVEWKQLRAGRPRVTQDN